MQAILGVRSQAVLGARLRWGQGGAALFHARVPCTEAFPHFTRAWARVLLLKIHSFLHPEGPCTSTVPVDSVSLSFYPKPQGKGAIVFNFVLFIVWMLTDAATQALLLSSFF